MSVGFGFSVGDFISALELVATVVDALRESGEAGNRYRALVRQLDALETVLLRVKRLELDESQHAEHVALQQAASQCQQTIDDFWEKIKKYQPALGIKGTASRLKEGWMKIRWAVCKKEDINSFKNDVAAHTDSIQLLLTTVQMSRTNLLESKACRRNLSLAGKIQVAYFECMKKISAVFEATSTGIEQGKQLIAASSKILQTNVQIFQAVLNIQNFITHIPAQVERQQPVYLIDALGRHSPFHLEFIRSAEAFTAVLQANFSKTGQARKKIGRGEFVIQNSLTKRDINIYDDWQNCFHPGQRVEMSVIFQRRWQVGSSCPGCGTICDGSTEADVKCPDCDMTFRRIIKIEDEKPSKTYSKVTHQQEAVAIEKKPLAAVPLNQVTTITKAVDLSLLPPSYLVQGITNDATLVKGKRKREYARDDELDVDLHLENIRRVRIQTLSRGITRKCRALFGYFEEDGRPEKAFCCGFRTNEDESCLIIEFEDSKSGALCDTINEQRFKQGGLFQTDLVEAEAAEKETEDSTLQITWMEEDEVQMYLKFYKDTDRDTIWDFIITAKETWRMRNGLLPDPTELEVADPEGLSEDLFFGSYDSEGVTDLFDTMSGDTWALFEQQTPLQLQTPTQHDAPIQHEAHIQHQAPLQHEVPVIYQDSFQAAGQPQAAPQHRAPLQHQTPLQHQAASQLRAYLRHQAALQQQVALQHQAALQHPAAPQYPEAPQYLAAPQHPAAPQQQAALQHQAAFQHPAAPQYSEAPQYLAAPQHPASIQHELPVIYEGSFSAAVQYQAGLHQAPRLHGAPLQHQAPTQHQAPLQRPAGLRQAPRLRQAPTRRASEASLPVGNVSDDSLYPPFPHLAIPASISVQAVGGHSATSFPDEMLVSCEDIGSNSWTSLFPDVSNEAPSLFDDFNGDAWTSLSDTVGDTWYPSFLENEESQTTHLYSDSRVSRSTLRGVEGDAANSLELKRARNTQAARRSRRMKTGRFKELKGQIKKSEEDRDRSNGILLSGQETIAETSKD